MLYTESGPRVPCRIGSAPVQSVVGDVVCPEIKSYVSETLSKEIGLISAKSEKIEKVDKRISRSDGSKVDLASFYTVVAH